MNARKKNVMKRRRKKKHKSSFVRLRNMVDDEKIRKIKINLNRMNERK
jgi:hypothetical protein